MRVLRMYVDIIDSYKNLDNKEDIDKNKVIFRGFCGNRECGYLNYAEFIIKNKSNFECLRKDYSNGNFNSHCEMKILYERMLLKYCEIDEYSQNRMTINQIKEVINAQFNK